MLSKLTELVWKKKAMIPPLGSDDNSDLDVPVFDGFPQPTGMSLSYWLQGVRASPLLDHRTTADIPPEADVVIIGSGVRRRLPILLPP